jgi:hypothetical protein
LRRRHRVRSDGDDETRRLYAQALRLMERPAPENLALDATRATAYAVLGNVHVHRGEWLEAETCYTKTVALDGADPMPRVTHASFVLQSVGHCARPWPCDGLSRSRYAAERGRRHREIARTEQGWCQEPACAKPIRRPRFHRINDLR